MSVVDLSNEVVTETMPINIQAKTLCVNEAEYSSSQIFTKFIELKELYMDDTMLTSLDSLSQANQITLLSARHSAIKHIRQMQNLQYLDILDNPPIQLGKSLSSLKEVYANQSMAEIFKNVFLLRFYPSSCITFDELEFPSCSITYSKGILSIAPKPGFGSQKCILSRYFVLPNFETSLMEERVVRADYLNNLPIEPSIILSFGLPLSKKNDILLQQRQQLIDDNKSFTFYTFELDGKVGVMIFNNRTLELIPFNAFEAFETQNTASLPPKTNLMLSERPEFLKSLISKENARPKKPAEKRIPSIAFNGELRVGETITVVADKIKSVEFYYSKEPLFQLLKQCQLVLEMDNINVEYEQCDLEQSVKKFNSGKDVITFFEDEYSIFLNIDFNDKQLQNPIEIELTKADNTLNSLLLQADTQGKMLLAEVQFNDFKIVRICEGFITTNIGFTNVMLKRNGELLEAFLFELVENESIITKYQHVRYEFKLKNELVQSGNSNCYHPQANGLYKCVATPVDSYGMQVHTPIESNIVKWTAFNGQTPGETPKHEERRIVQDRVVEQEEAMPKEPGQHAEQRVAEVPASTFEKHLAISAEAQFTPVNHNKFNRFEFSDSECPTPKLLQDVKDNTNKDTSVESESEEIELAETAHESTNLNKVSRFQNVLTRVDSQYVDVLNNTSETLEEKDMPSLTAVIAAGTSLTQQLVKEQKELKISIKSVIELFEKTNVRQRLLMIRQKLKAGRGMIFDKQANIIEKSQYFFENSFMELNSVFLLSAPKFLDYEFHFMGQVGLKYDFYFNIQKVEKQDVKLVIARSKEGGWLLILCEIDNVLVAAVPLCSKFEIINYKDYNGDLELPGDFIKGFNGQDDSVVQTFIISIEGLIIPFNSSANTLGSINKALQICYSEVVGSFSKETVSNKRYSQLAVNRLASIDACRRVYKNFNVISKNSSLGGLYSNYSRAEGIFDRQRLVCNFWLENMMCDQKQSTVITKDLIKMSQSDDPEFVETLAYALFEHPILQSYEEFKCLEYLQQYYIVLHGKLSQKLSEQLLPVELLAQVQDQREQLSESAAQIGSVSCMLLQTDYEQISAKDGFLVPSKTLCRFEELQFDAESDDFLEFVEFLPHFVNEGCRKLPKQYYQIVYYFRRLIGELDYDGDEPLLSSAGISYHVKQDGRRTVLVHGCIQFGSYDCKYEDYVSKVTSVYGECLINTLPEMRSSALAKFDSSCCLVLQQRQFLGCSPQVIIERETGLPFVYKYEGELDQNDLKLQAGCDITMVTGEMDTENGKLVIATTQNYNFDFDNNVYRSEMPILIRILKIFFPSTYNELGEEYLEKEPIQYQLENVSDIPEDENLDYEKSMSDAENNAHPYRGKVDEMNEDNEELQEALAAYYQAYKQADNVKAEIQVFRNTLLFSLQLISQEMAFVENTEYYPMFWEQLQWNWESPMNTENMERLECHILNTEIERIDKPIEEGDINEFEGLELK